MDREDWGSLAAFAVVAEERSFTRAAARLGVSPSALSHTMRRLEERLRIQLLARSTRSVSTTEAGERLLARLGPAIERDFRRGRGSRASARPAFGTRPDHRVQKRRSNGDRARAASVHRRPIPRSSSKCSIDPGLTNIVAQRFDAGIRLGESLEKDVVAVPVTGPLRMAVVGSPQYFASHPAPSTPHDLRKHRCINFRLPSAGTIYKWEFEKGRHKVEVGVDGPLVFDDEGIVLDAALAGRGPCVPDRGPGCLVCSRLARWRGCSRIGVRRFPGSSSITRVGARCRPHSRRSSTRSECRPRPGRAVDWQRLRKDRSA